MATGIMAAAFEAALKFAKSDTRGGAQPIMNHQSVADLLMDLKMKTDASRFLTWKAANAFDNGLGGELALEAKIYCSDNAVKAVVDAMSAIGMYVVNQDAKYLLTS
jgi:alkylation response protein AidB-like acyl-CoA dehydrogenase